MDIDGETLDTVLAPNPAAYEKDFHTVTEWFLAQHRKKNQNIMQIE